MATIQQLLAILPNSQQSAIHAEDIATRLELPTGRNQVETRQLIRETIQAGHTIVSNTRVGYWLSNNKTEIQDYITSLRSRADENKLRADKLRDVWNSANSDNVIP